MIVHTIVLLRADPLPNIFTDQGWFLWKMERATALIFFIAAISGISGYKKAFYILCPILPKEY